MEHDALVNILKSLHDHESSVEEALKKFRGLSFDDLGFARIDHHRGIRKGYPEVIFCQNKTTEHVLDITKNQIAHDETVFGTRANPETLDTLIKELPEIEVNRTGRCFWHKSPLWKKRDAVKGSIVIAAAGTSDLPVVEEARVHRGDHGASVHRYQ